MKIALYHNLPPGGALRALSEQAKRLSEKHQVVSFALSSSADNGHRIDEYLQNTNIIDFNIDHPEKTHPIGWYMLFKKYLKTQMHIAEQINSGEFDICFTNPCMYFEIPSLHRFLKIPSVYYAHSTTINNKDENRISLNLTGEIFKKFIIKNNLKDIKQADLVLTNSEFMKGLISEKFQINAVVNHLGVDIKLFYPNKENKRKNYILGVGALSVHKAHDLSIAAIGLIPENIRPELYIAYPYEAFEIKKNLIVLAEKNNVKLKFFEKLGANDLRSLYCEAIATIFPSINEPLGLVPLESMACGTPVMGVKEGGITETIINREIGFLLKRDPAEFTNLIIYLINNPNLINEIGNNGREYVIKYWSWEASVDGLEKYLAATLINK